MIESLHIVRPFGRLPDITWYFSIPAEFAKAAVIAAANDMNVSYRVVARVPDGDFDTDASEFQNWIDENIDEAIHRNEAAIVAPTLEKPGRRDDIMVCCAFLGGGLQALDDTTPGGTRVQVGGVNDHWGAGYLELIQALVAYAPYITDCISAAADVRGDYPGVVEYEIVEPFAAWWGMQVYKTHGPGVEPAPEIVRAEIRRCVLDMFDPMETYTGMEARLNAVPVLL